MAPSGFRLRCSEPRLCGKSRAHAGGAVKESDDCADQDSAPARTGSASALRPGFLRVPCNPRPCGKCPADGGRRERRHQEAEGGLRCSFRNPAAQPEMSLTACMLLESLPHTLRCGPCFGRTRSLLRTGYRITTRLGAQGRTADGRERRHQEAEGGLWYPFRNPTAQPEMSLTACTFLESLPHTLRCGPLFRRRAHSRLRTGHRLPPSWDRGPDGGGTGWGITWRDGRQYVGVC